MKKMAKLTALMLVVVTALSFAACSTYGKVQKALENDGYKVIDTIESVAKDLENEVGDKLAVKFHFYHKGLNSVTVIEFHATKDMLEYVKSSETVKGAIKDITENEDAQAFYKALVEKGYANGNCLVIAVGDAEHVRDIIKKA